VDLATGLLRLLPGSQPREENQQSLTVCASCASPLVQPQGWREPADGTLILSLRCPECFVRTSGSYDHERVAEYDEALIKGRQSLVADYELIVRHNMEELTNSFTQALDLDLIGPDDFGVPPERAGERESGEVRMASG
jgi:hypothetical protein